MGRKQLTVFSRPSGRAVIKRRIIIVASLYPRLAVAFVRTIGPRRRENMRDREKDTGTKTRVATKAIKSRARGI